MDKYRVVRAGVFAVEDRTVVGPREPNIPGQVIMESSFTERQWDKLKHMKAIELIDEPQEESGTQVIVPKSELDDIPKLAVPDRATPKRPRALLKRMTKRLNKKAKENAIL